VNRSVEAVKTFIFSRVEASNPTGAVRERLETGLDLWSLGPDHRRSAYRRGQSVNRSDEAVKTFIFSRVEDSNPTGVVRERLDLFLIYLKEYGQLNN
jgi:hypothetical protein